MNNPTYHDLNPQIYQAFKEVALMTIEKGHKTYSAKGIFELVRWTMGVKAENDSFKINNNYTPFYARKFIHENPQYNGFFELRFSKFD